jgi:hypothetical protein
MSLKSLESCVADAERAYHALVNQPFDGMSADELQAHCCALDVALAAYHSAQDRLRITVAVRETAGAIKRDGGLHVGHAYNL